MVLSHRQTQLFICKEASNVTITNKEFCLTVQKCHFLIQITQQDAKYQCKADVY
jgi:hypothetical protein